MYYSLDNIWVLQKEKIYNLRMGNNLDKNILLILERGEITGLEILDRLNSRKIFFKYGFHDLFPALHRLEKNNSIAWRWSNDRDESSDARRKYYYLPK